MKTLTDIYHINAFTNKRFNGNAAAVVYCEDLKPDTMQKIAKQMNLSETAFISKSDIADFNLKWFTPSVEVELCGHATIASLHYLKERNLIKNNSIVTFETLSGIIDCEVKNEKYFMSLPVPDFQVYNGKLNDLFTTLGLPEETGHNNIPHILQANGNLFIYVKTLEFLQNLSPNFSALKKICSENLGFTEVTVYAQETVEDGSHAHLRFFAPYYGIDEDPVTGSANGPLLLVLQKVGLIESGEDEKIYRFEQGDSVDKPGRVDVTYSSEKNKLVISGNAVTMMKGDIFI